MLAGNYVLKYASKPGNSSLRKLVFDNIGLVAADANNPGHEQWVQNLPTRNRLYVVINENDSALKWSRRKPGGEQKERLGSHPRNLSGWLPTSATRTMHAARRPPCTAVGRPIQGVGAQRSIEKARDRGSRKKIQTDDPSGPALVREPAGGL